MLGGGPITGKKSYGDSPGLAVGGCTPLNRALRGPDGRVRPFLRPAGLAVRRLQALSRAAGARMRFARQYRRFAELSRAQGLVVPLRSECRPYLSEHNSNLNFNRQYVYHPAWAARKLVELGVTHHHDISSLLDFATIASAFVPIEYYEYRPAPIHLEGLSSGAADLTALPFADDSLGSLSCMHVVEHLGLGRYGDPLDPTADRLAMSELQRVVALGGWLLFVVPVAHSPRIHFNAHRVYTYEQIVESFEKLELIEFTLIPDRAEDGALVSSPSAELLARQNEGCGCFLFRKPLEASTLSV